MIKFLSDETGAVTVDWVVMTAAVVGLGLASTAAVRTGTSDLGAEIGTALSDARVAGVPVAAFDFDDVTGLQRTGWGWVTWGSYQGWTAVGPVQQIEIVESGHRGVHSPDGGNWLDLDASPGNLVLNRGLEHLNAGSTYSLSFNAAHSHAQLGESVEVYFGGQLVDTVTPASNQFANFAFDVVAGSGDGSNQIEFRGTGAANNVGVSLHGIQVHRPLGQR